MRKYSSLAGLTACTLMAVHAGTACARQHHQSVARVHRHSVAWVHHRSGAWVHHRSVAWVHHRSVARVHRQSGAWVHHRSVAWVHHRSVIETGTASYYGKRQQGRLTASGQRFDPELLTAAHPWLPLGSRVRVTLLGTGRSVVVKITDRMPARRRIVDLSLAAARELGITHRGVARVRLTSR